MFVLRSAEVIIGVSVAAFLITQVMVPLWRGTLVLPMFRYNPARDPLIAARGDLEVAETEDLMEQVRAEARAFRKHVGDLKKGEGK